MIYLPHRRKAFRSAGIGGNDANTLLLMHFNNNLDDSSTGGGHGTGVSSEFKFGNYAAKFVRSSSQKATFGDHADWNFGSDDFTIETWIKFNDTSNYQGICGQGDNSNNWWAVTYYGGSDGSMRFVAKSGGSIVTYFYTGPWSPGTTEWHHIEVVRNGGDEYIFIDGISQSLTIHTDISGKTLPDLSGDLNIGYDGNSYYLDAQLDEFRISDTARHTSNFTPATSAHTSDANTSLLMHFDNDWDDSGNTGHGTAGTSNSPTFTSMSYATAKYGSGALEGASQWCYFPDDADWYFGSYDFTIDFWIKWANDSNNYTIAGQYEDSDNQNQVFTVGGSIRFRAEDSNNVRTYFYTGDISPGTSNWHHVAIVRNGGDEYIFYDGTSQGLTVNTDISGKTLGDLSAPWTICAEGLYDAFDGDIDEFRISDTARWTSNFTPPTGEYTT